MSMPWLAPPIQPTRGLGRRRTGMSFVTAQAGTQFGSTVTAGLYSRITCASGPVETVTRSAVSAACATASRISPRP